LCLKGGRAGLCNCLVCPCIGRNCKCDNMLIGFIAIWQIHLSLYV
jgi:hypothetical protein